MSRSARIVLLFLLSIGLLAAAPARAQGFGANKEKVTLQRKLPALVHLPGDTIKVVIASSDAEEDGALPYDFQALLETELLKDDPNLREDDNPATQIICHDHRILASRSRIHQQAGAGRGPWRGRPRLLTLAKAGAVERITGKLNVSFQAKDATGHTLISDNVESDLRPGVRQRGELNLAWRVGPGYGQPSPHAKGGRRARDGPPTPAELRSRLIIDAVQQIAEHLVNTE